MSNLPKKKKTKLKIAHIIIGPALGFGYEGSLDLTRSSQDDK